MKNKTKITYILSGIDRAAAFEWIVELLDKEQFELSFILLNNRESYFANYLTEKHIFYKTIHFSGKKDVLKAVFSIVAFLRKNKTDIVHCHLFEASLCGLPAAWLAGIKKRIYTRHYSNQHHTYFPKAVKYDLLINRMATQIVAISKNVREILINIEHVDEKKVHLIHHGFKLELFDQSNINPTNISTLKMKYNLSNKYPVVGVISRYIHLKGIQYIIPAFKKLLHNYPDAVLVLANAAGGYQNEIKKMLLEIPSGGVREIKFENDLFALYQLFDAFIHVPIDEKAEAFGQTYVEALAAGIPSVFTLSGVATEFIVDKRNALVVPYMNSDAIFVALITVLSDPTKNKSLIEQGKKDVKELFTINRMIQQLTKLYAS